MRRPAALLLAFMIILPLAMASLVGVATSKAAGQPTAQPWAPQVAIVGGNTISGTVYDMNGRPIPGAKVTLYYTAWTGYEYKAKGVFQTGNNPQTAGDGRISPAGGYAFTNIPADVYILTAEKDGFSISSEPFDVRGGSMTRDLTIDRYADKTITPQPSATRTPTPGPAAGSKLDVGAMILAVLNVAIMGIIGIQFLIGIAVIAFHVGRKN